MKSIFVDDSGKYSSGRLLMFLIVVWYLIMMTFVSLRTNTLPDFPLQAAGLISLLYGVNKFSPTQEFNKKQ